MTDPVANMLAYGPITPEIVGMCVIAPCSQVVAKFEPHVTLGDGSPVHNYCIGQYSMGGPSAIPVHRFSTGGLLPIPLLGDY